MWVQNGARQDTSQAMESFTFAASLLSLKQEYFKNKGPYKKNVTWLLYLAVRFCGFKYPFTKWKPLAPLFKYGWGYKKCVAG